MRQSHPNESLARLCLLFGVTRQAYYEAEAQDNKTSIAHMVVLTLVKDIRLDVPLVGTRKLLFMLTPQLEKHGIKLGRDQLFDLPGFHGLLIRRRKRMVKTTNSHHWLKKYPNLIKGLTLTAAEQLWVSDITYIRTLQGFNYLSLITDAYSRKIMGYALWETLEAKGPTKALIMAVQARQEISPFTLIHHSDRGIQYCSGEYVDILEKENIAISMTQNGSPYENALAERTNGAVKNEFFPKRIYQNHKEAKKAISKIIDTYNQKRPHASLDYLTPDPSPSQRRRIEEKMETLSQTTKAEGGYNERHRVNRFFQERQKSLVIKNPIISIKTNYRIHAHLAGISAGRVAPQQSLFPFVPAFKSKATYFLDRKLNAQVEND